MKIAIFGGAFDPPHFGHIKVVKNFLELNLVNEVWLLPVKNHAFAKQMAPAPHRLAMLNLVIKDYFSDLPVKICEYELDQPGLSITFETLKSLSQQYPEHEFTFLMGSDNLASFHKWHSYQEMLKEFVFYVYPRSGYDFSLLKPGMKALHDLEEMKVSSTVVREKLISKKPVVDLVPPKVVDYLTKHRLYSGNYANQD